MIRVSCGKECEDDKAILINTHYDTTLGSPGAMDAAVPIAIMIEMIRNLLHQPRTRHQAIFRTVPSRPGLPLSCASFFTFCPPPFLVFNGAEESLQDASHGFIVQHDLRNKVKMVVNLEGCGNSGKAILFQIGDGSLIEVYAKVSYPSGTVAVRGHAFAPIFPLHPAHNHQPFSH